MTGKQSPITLDVKDGIAVVRMDAPDEKVNTLGAAMMDGVQDVLRQIQGDPTVKAAVLISAKKDSFIAGADIKMLADVKSAQEMADLSARGQELLGEIADSKKPFIAAIHGSCLGGGLEVALACHYRIATDHKKTVLALPEVMLGLLPGAGGTQRLPRLVGAQAALDMMLTGKNIRVKKAKKMGLVDDVVLPFGLEDVAVEAAKRIVAGKLKHKEREPSPQDRALEETGPGRALLFKQAKGMVMKQTRGLYPAPLAILDVVETGLNKGMEAGLEAEAKRFGELSQTPESKSLISLFFGQTALKKNRFGDDAKPVHTLGVLGAGLMGAGIAQVSVTKGSRVLLKDVSMDGAARGLKQIHGALNKRVRRKAMTSFAMKQTMARVSGQTDYAGFQNADLVIEAVFESIDLKHRVLKEAEEHLPEHAVFASNTSALPISAIAEASKRPERVVGMHYFSPVPKMPLLEIITTDKTADDAAAMAVQYGIKQGKTVIVVKDGPGFYTTRILAPLMDEAVILMSEGMDFHRLDGTMKAFGFPVGPVTLLDEVGIDVGAHVAHDLGEAFGARVTSANPEAAKAMVDAGMLGRKSGKGFFLYEERDGFDGQVDKVKKTLSKVFGGSSGGKPVNPEALKVLEKYMKSDASRDLDPSELQQRVALRMVNEAALCLQEGILRDAVDGDIGAVFGLGFPPFRGGPFRYVDQVGPSAVVSTLRRLADKYGERFEPAPILVDMAKAGKRFY